MPIVEIIRIEENGQAGTFGVLKIAKQAFCVTLEPVDRDNEPFRSSIPAQQYTCNKIISPKFGRTFQIVDVPGRDMVLFHAGNVVEHTEGCILLAQYYGKLRGERAVLNSGNTFRQFMEILKDESSFNLTISEKY